MFSSRYSSLRFHVTRFTCVNQMYTWLTQVKRALFRDIKISLRANLTKHLYLRKKSPILSLNFGFCTVFHTKIVGSKFYSSISKILSNLVIKSDFSILFLSVNLSKNTCNLPIFWEVFQIFVVEMKLRLDFQYFTLRKLAFWNLYSVNLFIILTVIGANSHVHKLN